VIRFGEVRNIEFRHSARQTSSVHKDQSDNMLTEVLTTHHAWEVYVTTSDESILIAKTSHSHASDLTRQRVQDVAGAKFGADFEAAVEYYRQHEEDQKLLESAENWAHSAAIVFAGAIGCRLVVTSVGDELGLDDLKKMMDY
jgi:hypothetical protein